MPVPATAKKPTDRKPKVDESAPLTATVNGIEFTVDRDALDDFELVDDFARMDDGDATRMPSVLRRLVGDEQYRKALDSCRGESGRVTVEAGTDFVAALLGELDPNS